MMSSLELNDHVFGKPREVFFLTVAAALHLPLLLWQGKPYLPSLDPIAEIEFKIEDESVPEPVKVEPEKPKNIFQKVQKMMGLASKPAPVEKLLAQSPKDPGLEGAAGTGKIATVKRATSILQGEKLADRSGAALSGNFNVASIKTGGSGLAGGGIGAAPIATQGGGTLKEKSTAFRLGSKDVPFAIKRGGNELSGDEAAPRIAVGGAGDKGTRKISTQFFGSGGGTGGGDGKGHGSGGEGGKLTDKGGGAGSGLAGTGGFGMPSGIAGDGSAGGGTGSGSGLQGTGSGGGGVGQKSPYEITGPLSGRKILHLVLPELPDWVKQKGLILAVSIKFYVRHSGDVRAGNITVERSSGYQKLDSDAINALKQWRFEPLPESQYGREQYGVITFKFKAV